MPQCNRWSSWGNSRNSEYAYLGTVHTKKSLALTVFQKTHRVGWGALGKQSDIVLRGSKRKVIAHCVLPVMTHELDMASDHVPRKDIKE